MKLLIITQVIDIEHPILGFFHRWVEEFAKHCEHVHVICLQEGKHDLPENVTVHSLGKNEGKGRFVYLLRFYSLIWKLRHEYESVFVHMNQIYVILGAPFWRALGKKVGLWYAHGKVTISLHVSVWLSDIIFTSTKEGMRIGSSKRMIVGQGIDNNLFINVDKEPNKICNLITVGRVSKSKNIDTLLQACALLKEQDIEFYFQIIGIPTINSEAEYLNKMKSLVTELGLENEVEWVGPVSQANLPVYLQKADIFIHDGSTDSLDKALLEAVLSGCIVVSSNLAYRTLAKAHDGQFLYNAHDSKALSTIISNVTKIGIDTAVIRMSPIYKYVINTYSIENLILKMLRKY